MPSPLGHALGGAAIAWLTDARPGKPASSPNGTPEGLRYVWPCVALAMLPDADLLLPIAHRTVTHSLAAVAAVALTMIVLGVVTGKVTARFGAACVAAYASHLVLDWMQADPTPPYGIQLLWPFSPAWFISGWDLFKATERRHVLEAATIRRNAAAMLQEAIVLGPVAAAAWLVRVKALAGLAAEVPRRDHSPE